METPKKGAAPKQKAAKTVDSKKWLKDLAHTATASELDYVKTLIQTGVNTQMANTTLSPFEKNIVSQLAEKTK